MPAATLATAKTYILDWLGSALAGASTDAGRILLAYARAQPQGPCTIIGPGLRGAAATSAFVNGALSHIVEMDDLDRGSVIHPGAVVIPAALAVAEREEVSGHDFASAVVAGYEVAIRIGEAVGKRHYRYFHNTSTCGVFGAAAAAGWILGLDVDQMVWALGNAGTQACGLWEFNAEGSMSKHLHAGHAASSGVLSADLAALDFTGASRILEGDRGFFAGMAPDADAEAVLADIDGRSPTFKINGVSIKPHASCRHTHPAIDASLELRSRVSAPVSRIGIDTYQAALDLCDNADPQTPYEAKFSLQYCVATALSRGRAGLAEFTKEAIQDASVRGLMAVACPTVSQEHEDRYPSQWPASVSVSLDDGSTISATVTQPKGDPENPLTDEELDDKFRLLAECGGYGAAADGWLQWVDSLSQERLSLPGKTP